MVVHIGDGWTHAWLSRKADAGTVERVLVALAEVGLSPHHVGTHVRCPNPLLVYRRTLTGGDVATIEKAVRLAGVHAA